MDLQAIIKLGIMPNVTSAKETQKNYIHVESKRMCFPVLRSSV